MKPSTIDPVDRYAVNDLVELVGRLKNQMSDLEGRLERLEAGEPPEDEEDEPEEKEMPGDDAEPEPVPMEVKPRRSAGLPPRACKRCDGAFVPKQERQQFCTARCRKRHWDEQKAAEARERNAARVDAMQSDQQQPTTS